MSCDDKGNVVMATAGRMRMIRRSGDYDGLRYLIETWDQDYKRWRPLVGANDGSVAMQRWQEIIAEHFMVTDHVQKNVHENVHARVTRPTWETSETSETTAAKQTKEAEKARQTAEKELIPCGFENIRIEEARQPGGIETDSDKRKDIPVFTGFVDYFPLAMAEVARLSKAANDKHNPGEPLHWSKHLSNDHADCLMRHLLEAGTMDTDGFSHTVKVAWRAMALLQIELEGADNGGRD